MYSPPEIGLLSSSGRSLLPELGVPQLNWLSCFSPIGLKQPRSLFLFRHWSSDGWQESWSSGSQTAFILQEIVPKSRALLVPGQTIAPRRGVNIYCSLTFALRLLLHKEYPSPILNSFDSPFHFNHYKWYLSESHHNCSHFNTSNNLQL